MPVITHLNVDSKKIRMLIIISVQLITHLPVKVANCYAALLNNREGVVLNLGVVDLPLGEHPTRTLNRAIEDGL